MGPPDFQEQHKVETYKSLITISTEVFKYLILLNGGAAAGMLAGIDKIVRVIDSSCIRVAMICFVVGLVLATMATFGAYFTQRRLHEENIGAKSDGGHSWGVLGVVIACFSSLVAFSSGALVAALNIGS